VRAGDGVLRNPRLSRVEMILRDVVEADIPVLFEHQLDPEATRMAAFPSRGREEFTAHWLRTLARDDATAKAIVLDGQVAGNIGCWNDGDRRLVGYWIGREFWGRGLATRALAALVADEPRPLHAWVVATNPASIRVLEKCGFVRVGSHIEHNDALGEELEEVLFELA
jgi:RimJ/RimL family protein N-acetyltransferase